MSSPQTPLSPRRQCSWTLYFIYFYLFNTNINKSAGFLILSADIFPLSSGSSMTPILPNIKNSRLISSQKIIYYEKWDYKDYIPYLEWKYGKKIKPVSRRSECDIDDNCTCPRCNAPKPYLYKNNGSKGQILCKVCSTAFSPEENRFSKSYSLKCPHCNHSLAHKKDRKHFVVHKCVNPKCPYYLHNLNKVDKKTLRRTMARTNINSITSTGNSR